MVTAAFNGFNKARATVLDLLIINFLSLFNTLIEKLMFVAKTVVEMPDWAPRRVASKEGCA